MSELNNWLAKDFGWWNILISQLEHKTAKDTFVVVYKQVELDQYIGLLILFANIGLLQIYQYQHICSPIYADIKTVF